MACDAFWIEECTYLVATLALGSRPRQRGRKVTSQKEGRESLRMLPGVQENEWEWTLTLPKGIQLWELESRCILEFSERYFRGQNSISGKVFYTIGKLLELRCLKWARITPLDIWNISYGQKKGWESNCQFDSWSLKVENRPNLLVARGRATYRWKSLDKSYNFASDCISIQGLIAKLWGSKSRESQLGRDSHLGVSGQKVHLDVGVVDKRKVYYKGEGDGFP
jgi:hypothetical protein